MYPKLSISLALAAALSLAGLALGEGMSGMDMSSSSPSTTQPATTQPSQAIDVQNTVCPVSGEKIADSDLVEVYKGKVYHLCCPDCTKDFEKDPEKFAKAVSADPHKYGIK